MSIDTQSESGADLQIGPTDQGMVRLYIFSEEIDIPLDFDPDDAEAMAEELLAAAQAARRGMEGGTK